jgi:hypothetical protein
VFLGVNLHVKKSSSQKSKYGSHPYPRPFYTMSQQNAPDRFKTCPPVTGTIGPGNYNLTMKNLPSVKNVCIARAERFPDIHTTVLSLTQSPGVGQYATTSFVDAFKKRPTKVPFGSNTEKLFCQKVFPLQLRVNQMHPLPEHMMGTMLLAEMLLMIASSVS